MGKIILYHGSQKIIEKPLFGIGKTYNDYGQGFYCTQNLDLAKEWACPASDDGFANIYELDTDGLKLLDLQTENFCTLHWLAILVNNRKFDLDTPIMRQGVVTLPYRSPFSQYSRPSREKAAGSMAMSCSHRGSGIMAVPSRLYRKP